MGSTGVFGLVFADNGNDFYYDAHLNEIVEIEPALAAVLPRFEKKPNSEILAELAPVHGALAVRDALAAIATGRRRDGLFRSERPVLVPATAVGNPDEGIQHLVLTLTERCNLRCAYCLHGAQLNWMRGHSEAVMTPETALAALEYFLAHCADDAPPAISFYGGEALQELTLIETVVAAARRHRAGREATIVIDTNGVLVDDRVAELVHREGLFLQISLDGPRAVHDRHRRAPGGAGSFDDVMAGLDRVLGRESGVHERLSFVATLAPPVDLDAVASFFQDFPPYLKHGVTAPPRLRANVANLAGQDWPGLEQGQAELAAWLERATGEYLAAVAAGRREETNPLVRALCEPELLKLRGRVRGPAARLVPGGNCVPGRRKLHVMPDGSYHPCERTGNAMSIGSVKQGIRPDRVHRLQQRFHAAVKERCSDCWAVRICGLCFAAQAEHGAQVPEAVCRAVRKGRERGLKMAARVAGLPEERRAFLAPHIPG